MHSLPGGMMCDFILLPYGYMQNREYDKARPGDILVFHEGERRMIRAVRRMRMDAVCDSFCRMRYGIPLKRLLEEWRMNAFYLGAGKGSVSSDECLVVFYGDVES